MSQAARGAGTGYGSPQTAQVSRTSGGSSAVGQPQAVQFGGGRMVVSTPDNLFQSALRRKVA